MFQIMWYTSSKNFDLSNVRTLYDLLEQSTIPRSTPKVDYLLDLPILGNSKRARTVSKPTPTCSLHPIDDRYVSTFYNERVDTYLEGVRGKKKIFEEVKEFYGAVNDIVSAKERQNSLSGQALSQAAANSQTSAEKIKMIGKNL